MHNSFLNKISALPVYKKLYGLENETLDAGIQKKLPFLSKDYLRSTFPIQWLTKEMESDIRENKTEINTTSGTSGKPLQIIRKKDWWQDEYLRLSKVHPLLSDVFVNKKRRAVLTTTICSNTFCSRTALHYNNRVFDNILHLNITPNPVNWERNDILRMCEEWNRFEPYNLDADPMYLAIFLTMKDKFAPSVQLYKPTFLTLSYEYCPRTIYQLIEESFNLPILMLYGLTELGFLYYKDSTCGSYHVVPEAIEVCFKEIDAQERLYELVVTSEKNEYMPLVRYQTGDVVKIKKGFEKYVGTAPNNVLLEEICGRYDDMLWVNGKLVTISDVDQTIFNNTSNIFSYRVSIDGNIISFQYTTQSDISPQEKIALENALKQLFNCETFRWIQCGNISPASSGKFKLFEKV